ncbi:unnamed protein product [Absidia cylindrospora]
MRAVCAFLGGLLVPMSYMTLRDGGHSTAASLVTAMAVCFENSLITNSRLILLDAYLLFFTGWTLMSWNKFFKVQDRPLTLSWWGWLTMTGLGLGCTVSSKWVGLFIIATIGCSTMNQLWHLWGDLTITKARFMQHFMARTLCLILFPVGFYIATFYLHFYLLPNAGPGDSMMSSHFQHSLIGHEIQDSPKDITFGSIVTLRHLGTNGGYLHSHKSSYPEGSKQQQVTLYPYQDDNNWWIIRRMNDTLDFSEKTTGDVLGADGKTWLDYVRHGDLIRLDHLSTRPKRLHSHDIKAPISDQDSYKEVSGYGFPDYEGDSNDYWRVMIPSHQDNDRLETLRTSFQLVHPLQSCALYSGSNKKLPDWGFGQQEVACIQSGKLPKTLWMVEETRNDLLPVDQTSMVNYAKPGFWIKFKELHQRMWTSNKELTESHPYQSRPSDWPMLRRGVSFWARDQRHVYFLGNPLVYWSTTVAVFTFLILSLFFMVRSHRHIKERFDPGLHRFYQRAAGFYTMAWAFHYLPFYVMGRQLFLHHYLPALYCAILVLGVGVDCILQKWSRGGLQQGALRWLFTGLCILALVATFYQYTPLTYGLDWDQTSCRNAQWLPLWEFDCGRYTQKTPSSSFFKDSVPTSFMMNANERDSMLYASLHGHHSEL